MNRYLLHYSSMFQCWQMKSKCQEDILDLFLFIFAKLYPLSNYLEQSPGDRSDPVFWEVAAPVPIIFHGPSTRALQSFHSAKIYGNQTDHWHWLWSSVPISCLHSFIAFSRHCETSRRFVDCTTIDLTIPHVPHHEQYSVARRDNNLWQL